MVDVKLEIPEIPHMSYNTNLLVLDSSNVDIILGVDFISKKGTIRNYFDNRIEIDRKIIFQAGIDQEAKDIEPDQILVEKCSSLQEKKLE